MLNDDLKTLRRLSGVFAIIIAFTLFAALVSIYLIRPDDVFSHESNCFTGIFHLCFTRPDDHVVKIFGFGEFLSALALLALVFTVSDVRYKFRIAVAPIPLYKITFITIASIGFISLLTEVWLHERWFVPDIGITQSLWQLIIGCIFLMVILIWISVAYFFPPKFGMRNYQMYGKELFNIILKGTSNELGVIADELGRSVESIIDLAYEDPQNNVALKSKRSKKLDASDTARAILSLIGNRKFCRHVIESCPTMAIDLFEEMTLRRKYQLPVGVFAKNISAEAINNFDSSLYHEDNGYRSGYLGDYKPFSQAIYGNYRLGESLGIFHGSPLDIDFEAYRTWGAKQYETYSRIYLITFCDYLKNGSWTHHSPELLRGLHLMKEAPRNLYNIKRLGNSWYQDDSVENLKTAIDFARNIILAMQNANPPPPDSKEIGKDVSKWDFYDHTANFLFELICIACQIEQPEDISWTIQHNMVWNCIFPFFLEGEVLSAVQFKLKQKLVDEIKILERRPDFKSAAILGLCLNVMGLDAREQTKLNAAYFDLHKDVLDWTIKNYLKLRSAHPPVAAACIIGSLEFDEQSNRMVHRWFRGLSLTDTNQYLTLSA